MDEYSLASNDISAFIDDKAGNIWIGTRGGGISLYSTNKSKFTSLSYDSDNEWGIKNNNIFSISSLSYGNMLWISNDFGLELISSDGLREYDYSNEVLNVKKITVLDNINDDICGLVQMKVFLKLIQITILLIGLIFLKVLGKKIPILLCMILRFLEMDK